ncbi:MAG: TAXI family TRAP transporter solute-binding subunit [Ectothiorhodospiraceae bacterium]|nr:TAXI family TRAP transporter solute-binding subunit [Chromatiales bacterium]MCP5155471.1 TAXI family TRAP transporter solute-binding subunit [Ectothiorhodospiraceae bacterium]
MRAQARIATIIAATTLVVATASAAEVAIPKQISWTAYGTTSSGYAQSVGLGQMLKKRYDVDLRIIPGKNDVSRMAPLRAGQSDICACGIAAYFAQEGVLMFADKAWGPMRIYNLFNNVGRNGQQAATAYDAEIRSAADLKGKRVTWVRGADALNTNMTAMLAFGGLTWDDVTKVEVPGWKQSVEAVINGQADAVWGSTVSSAYNQLAASPRGVYLPPLPHADTAAWERARAVAPWWAPTTVSAAVVGTKNEMPYEGSNYPYPIFVVKHDTDDALAYGLTKAVMENYEEFKESGPSMDGYQLGNQNFSYVFPYHPAAVAYYKEKGVWTAAHDEHNTMLVRRQEVIAAAWEKMKAMDVADDAFRAEWMKLRAAALTEAGMPVIFN